MGTATLIGKFHRLNGATFETTRLKSIGRKLKRGQKLDRTEDRGQLLAPVSGSDRQSAISVQLLAGLETNKKGLNQDIFDEKKKELRLGNANHQVPVILSPPSPSSELFPNL